MPQGSKKAFVTPLDTVDTTDKEGLGTLRWEGNKCYKYIQYSEEAAAVDGVADEVCYYVGTAGYANNDVTSDLSASDEVGAGVLQASLSDNEYGWIQIKGYAVLSIALTAGADGDALTPTGAGDGTLDVVVTTVALMHPCAFAGDISAKQIMCDFLF
jgi:hypothetical protein